MAFCSKCGSQLPKMARFCTECGAAIDTRNYTVQTHQEGVADGDIRRCPNCGESLPSFEMWCPMCGFELRNSKPSSAVQDLSDQLAKIETDRRNTQESAAKMLVKRLTSKKDDIDPIDKSIANIIRNFPVPNTKEDVIEFMMLASANMDDSASRSINTKEYNSRKIVTEAWRVKFEQVYQKAAISFGDSDDFYHIEAIYDQKQQESRDKKAKSTKFLIINCVVLVIMFCALGLLSQLEKEDNNRAGKINPPISSNEINRQDYQDIIQEFTRAGFNNIKTEKIEDLITGWLTKDGEVEDISITGKTSFSKEDAFPSHAEIIIRYHTFPERSEEALIEKPQEKPQEKEDIVTPGETATDNSGEHLSEDAAPVETSPQDEILTVENCSELAELLAVTNQSDPKIKDFAAKYSGRIIEFDGNTANVINYRNYDTRFNFLIGAGDYSEETFIGPAFQFRNVNYYDLHLTGNNIPKSVGEGLNIHITAKVDKYEELSSLFLLEPISIEIR